MSSMHRYAHLPKVSQELLITLLPILAWKKCVSCRAWNREIYSNYLVL